MIGPTWQEACYGHGPTIVAWLERDGALSGLDETDRKLIRRWRSGSDASFWVIDRLLTGLGHHVSELPDETWLVHRSQQGRAA